MRIHFALSSLAVMAACMAAAVVFWLLVGGQATIVRNVACVGLMHELAGNEGDGRAARFRTWAAQQIQSPRPDPQAIYGLALLTIRTTAEQETPLNPEVRGYLDSLELYPMYHDRLLSALVHKARTPADKWAIAGMWGEPQASRWLARNAGHYWWAGDRTSALVWLEVFNERGHPASLTWGEARALADVYAEVGWDQWGTASDRRVSLTWFDRALALVPDHLMALVWKGNALGVLGDTVARGNLTRLALERHPRESEAWRFWGLYLASEGRSSEAESALRRAVDLGPSNAWVRVSLAQMLLRFGSCSEALLQAQQVRDSDDLDLSTHRLSILGDAYWCLGDQAAATDAYRQLVTLQPAYCERLRDRLSPCP